jgi:tRNA pseudouridine38-40 synthase
MIEAACAVVGKHDFTSFAAVDARKRRLEPPKGTKSHKAIPAGENVREIFVSSWVREADEFIYTVRGSGFLHHMVRNLVGTFLLVGRTLAASSVKNFGCARSVSGGGYSSGGGFVFGVGGILSGRRWLWRIKIFSR